MELKVGHIYRAKKPGRVNGKCFDGPSGYFNDRMVIWLGVDAVQYDGPAVRMGRKLVSKETFLAWAGEDITATTPKGAWNTWNTWEWR